MSKELQNQIEAILFASGKGVSLVDICKICDTSEKITKEAVLKLKEEYDGKDSGLQINFTNDKWKLTVRSKYLPHIEKLVSETELSGPILKTLAVVAFKSPVIQSEIIDIRGQGAYEHINELLKEGFITKDAHGRSYMIKITDKFYNYFDVEGDEEIRDVFAKLKQQQEQKLGELEVIEIEHIKKEKEKSKTTQLGLEVVSIDDAKDHENIFDKTPEETTTRDEIKQEKQEERVKQKSFLAEIDSQIEEISKRLNNSEDVESTESETDAPEEEKEEENYL